MITNDPKDVASHICAWLDPGVACPEWIPPSITVENAYIVLLFALAGIWIPTLFQWVWRLTRRKPKLNGDDQQLLRARRQFVILSFAKLTNEEMQWLSSMLVTGRPVQMPDDIGMRLGDTGLIERDFTGLKGIKEELKPFVSQCFRSRQYLADLRAQVAREVKDEFGLGH